jgi:cobalamin synthase
MIGNPKWFNVRKYTGWGLCPNCWQGWLYIGSFIAPLAIINLTSLDQNIKNILTIIWAGLFLFDVIHIMSQIKKDERERLHEAIADRNALWFMIFVLLIGAFIKQIFDPIFFIAILGAMVIKAATHFYLRDK